MMTTAELTPSDTPTIPRSDLRVQGCFRSRVQGPGFRVLGFLVQGLEGGGRGLTTGELTPTIARSAGCGVKRECT